MKRFHVHVAVDDIEQGVRFYSALFGAAPARREPDYAKWMVEDPRINFAISSRGGRPGIDHVGLQVDSAEELANLREQLRTADAAVIDELGSSCCYARSDKHWITDPAGVAWESFHTLDNIPTFNGLQPIVIASATGQPAAASLPSKVAACCSPGPDSSCCPAP
jgi:catechol 2,3-dioxygenase-like lactoylglutathione lyase family enzyme